MAALFARLTPESRYQRFLSPKRDLTPRELTFFTDIDHLNHEAIAAVDEHDNSIVGVARYVRDAGRADVAELAIEVADAFQRMGIGTALTSLTIHHAHANGWRFLTATTLWENRAARGLLRHHGFRARRSRGGEIEHELTLEESSPREAVRVPENPRLVARAASVPSPSSTGGTTNSRLTASDSPTANAIPQHINRKEPPCPRTSTADSCARSSPSCAVLAHRTSHNYRAHSAQPGNRTAPRAVERSPAMTTTPTTYRELDQRTADGLAVTLEWNPATDALRVVVVDRESAAVTFPVRAEDASDAFVHPFVYAGRAVCEAP